MSTLDALSSPAPFEAKNTFADWLPKERRVIVPRLIFGDSSSVVANDLLNRIWDSVKGLRFDATALPVDDLVFETSTDGLLLTVRMLVPDRDKPDTLAWIQIWRAVIVPWAVLESNGTDYLVRLLRDTVAQAIAHEVEESLTYRGVRVFDPHR